MTDAIRPSDFLGTYLYLLEETFDGPPRPGQGNAYLDKQTGWLQTLAGLSAERASRPVAPGATSVAAQVRHTLSYLEVLEALAGSGPARVHGSRAWVTGS